MQGRDFLRSLNTGQGFGPESLSGPQLWDPRSEWSELVVVQDNSHKSQFSGPGVLWGHLLGYYRRQRLVRGDHSSLAKGQMDSTGEGRARDGAMAVRGTQELSGVAPRKKGSKTGHQP